MEPRITTLFYILITMTIKFGGLYMENYCAFSKNHKCLKWMDYQLTRFELAEADEPLTKDPQSLIILK